MLSQLDPQLSADSTTSTSTDEELMGRIQAQDEAALALFYRRHTALLRTIISRVVNNDEDVNDVLQEVLLELWNRSMSYDECKGKALGWVVTLARRRAIDRIRRRQAYSRAEERNRLQIESQQPAVHAGADEDAQEADRTEIFKEILATLPTAQREALEFAYYRGLSQREIAAKTGIPLGTIKTRLELGLRKVRAAIFAMGGAQEWALAA